MSDFLSKFPSSCGNGALVVGLAGPTDRVQKVALNPAASSQEGLAVPCVILLGLRFRSAFIGTAANRPILPSLERQQYFKRTIMCSAHRKHSGRFVAGSFSRT